jgi:Asp-tRNA(Asn)/Glu-tRNA(Gln) amidotransferase A subunit family amidase
MLDWHFARQRKRSAALKSLTVLTVLAWSLCGHLAVAADVNVVELTIGDAQAGMAAGRFSAVDLVNAYLARIQKYDPAYNSITILNPRALDEARAIDARRAAGERLGPLAGIPIVVKDSYNIAGLPTTAGWSGFSKKAGGIELVPTTDAPAVARLRAAGAIILGKTNLPPFSGDGTRANASWAGPTYNAVDRSLAPGGSSTGTATAVSASFAMAGMGEETGASIQNPAAAQDIVGVRPTFGLVPNTGVMPVSGSVRDVLGPHARSVTDAALMLDALSGYTAEDPKTVASFGHVPKDGYTSKLDPAALRGRRIGLYGPGWRKQPLSPETQALYDRAVSELEKLGAIVVKDPFGGSGFADLSPPPGRSDDRGKESIYYDFEKYLEALGPDSPYNSLAKLKERSGKSPFDPDQPLERWIKSPVVQQTIAHPGQAPDLSEFRATREAMLSIFNRVMGENKLDALIYPQMVKEEPKLAGTEPMLGTTVSETSVVGLPGVVTPAGFYASGAPFALIFFGRQWSEADLLAYAFAYEQATK